MMLPAIGNAISSTQFSAPLTKTELAYRQIRQEIVEGALAPGVVLDQEALAVRLGLSTTPIREALRMLESEQLVINRRHRNTMVAPLDATLLEQTYAVRMNLDPFAVGLATANATDAEREAIREVYSQAAAAASPAATLSANRRLHRTIYAASGNAVLTSVLDVLWDRSDRYRMLTLHSSSHAQRAHDEHQSIVDAVLAGDVDRATELMRTHTADSLARIRAESQVAD